jgi:hypothetical protein
MIPNWKNELHRLWSIRISLAIAVFGSIAGCASFFVDVFNPWLLFAVTVFANVVLIPLRLIKQATPDDGDDQ